MKLIPFKLGLTALALIALGGAAPAPSEDALAALNKTALAAYSAGRQQYIDNPGPIILAGLDLTFILGGHETHASYTPPLYTTLKVLSHAYLGTIVVLEPFADDAAAHQDVWRPHLEAIRRDMQAIDLTALGLDPASVARNRIVFDEVQGFIDAALKTGSFTGEGLTALGRRLRPLLMTDADQAAKAQLDSMKQTVDGWRIQMGPAAWSQVTVVVEGPHQPRKNNLQMAFFRHELGDQAPSHLLYAENTYDEASVMRLIGTVEADRKLAVITFDDPLRMQRDLLGDAAAAYLPQLFGTASP